MTTRYRCDSCPRVLDEDEVIRRPEYVTTEYWGCVATTHIGDSLRCPCGGEVTEAEIDLCDRCGEAEAMVSASECAACDAITEREECEAIRRESRERRHAELISTLVDIARGTPV